MLNRIVIMGRMTRDSELRTSQSGISLCSFTLAVDRDHQARDANEKKTDFIDCVAWRQTADFVNKYFSKGSMAIVLGALQIDSYQKDGENRRSAKVNVENIYFGESKRSSSAGVDVHVDDAPVQQRDISELAQFSEVNITGAQQQFVDISEDDGDLPF